MPSIHQENRKKNIEHIKYFRKLYLFDEKGFYLTFDKYH